MGALAILAFVFGLPGGVLAGDSPAECAAAQAAWREESRSAAEPEVYASMGDGIAKAALFGVAAVVPSVGIELDRAHDGPALALAWSASVPFGPVTACRSGRHSRDLYRLRALRAVLEGGVVLRSSAWPYLRPGLRGIWHRSAWPLGIGAGLGTTLALMPDAHGAASVSPELLLHYGRCCDPGYLLLALRADMFFPRRYPTSALASLTFAFW